MKIGSINITIYQTTSLRNGLYLTNTTTDIYHTSTDEYLLIDNYVFNSTGYVSALDNETYRTFLFKITALEDSVFYPFWSTDWSPVFQYPDYMTNDTTETETESTTTTESSPTESGADTSFSFLVGVVVGAIVAPICIYSVIFSRRLSNDR